MDGRSAHPFGATTELDLLTGTYTFADLLLNGQPTDGGKSHLELCNIAGKWGSPWYRVPTAGNGYPILQWQYDRGDYREICGFDPNANPTGIEVMPQRESGEAASIYNLAGQKITKGQSSLSKGIYIVNGKKVIVK